MGAKPILLKPYSITFAANHIRDDPHPFDAAHPDGWLVVLAESDADVTRMAYGALSDRWSMSSEGDEPGMPSLYPLGVLGYATRDSSSRSVTNPQMIFLDREGYESALIDNLSDCLVWAKDHMPCCEIDVDYYADDDDGEYVYSDEPCRCPDTSKFEKYWNAEYGDVVDYLEIPHELL